MTRRRRRERLVIPAVLAVTALAVAIACGDDGGETTDTAGDVVACADVAPEADCVPCRSDDGSIACSDPEPACFLADDDCFHGTD